MTITELYQSFRREEIRRRRALGWRGRIAERDERVAALNRWTEQWYDIDPRQSVTRIDKFY